LIYKPVPKVGGYEQICMQDQYRISSSIIYDSLHNEHCIPYYGTGDKDVLLHDIKIEIDAMKYFDLIISIQNNDIRLHFDSFKYYAEKIYTPEFIKTTAHIDDYLKLLFALPLHTSFMLQTMRYTNHLVYFYRHGLLPPSSFERIYNWIINKQTFLHSRIRSFLPAITDPDSEQIIIEYMC
jgi:hypothetical protein